MEMGSRVWTPDPVFLILSRVPQPRPPLLFFRMDFMTVLLYCGPVTEVLGKRMHELSGDGACLTNDLLLCCLVGFAAVVVVCFQFAFLKQETH